MIVLLLITELFAVQCAWSQALEQSESARLLGRCMIWVETNQGNTTSDAYTYCSQFIDTINNFFGSISRGPTDEIAENALSEFISRHLNIQPNKKPLLWSGAYVESQVAASRFGPYASLEATLLGYCMDGWDMCLGLSGAQRPPWQHCQLLRQFWSLASQKFASLTSGVVSVLINASRNPILRENSIFENKEVPLLQSGKVKRLDLHLMDPYQIQTSNPCDFQELDKVKRILELKNISLNCKVNTGLASRLACIVDASRPICNRAPTSSYAHLLGNLLPLLLFAYLSGTTLL